MTTTVVHLIQHLSSGGASRALIALAKHSARLGPFRHQVVSLAPVEAPTLARAHDAGLDVIEAPESSALRRVLADADIVQVHWWNNPELNTVLHSDLPAMRLVVWYHVAGHAAPQVITPDLVRFADLNVATNPWTYSDLPVFRDLPPADREHRLALIIDPADLERVEAVRPQPHTGFNVGYVGTVDFVKMHPDYVALSAAVRIPEARFVVCGHGCENVLRDQARRLGAEDRFEFRGYVEDIPAVLACLDVYGYPLGPDTYASGELNLQEVMRAGIPPVVFPHGGIRGLVDHDRTGLVVHSATEYRDAIEHLYHVPEDRLRLGRAAAVHAADHYGAVHAARKLHPLYQRLLQLPKQPRSWGCRPGESLLTQPLSLFEIARPPGLTQGARLFLESLGDSAEPFFRSLIEEDPQQALVADRAIARSSRLLRSAGCGGIAHYRQQYANDPWLRYWNGLVSLDEGRWEEARSEFTEAFHGGCHPGRAAWRCQQAANAGSPTLPPSSSASLPNEMTRSLCDWLASVPSNATDQELADPELHKLRQTAQGLAQEPQPDSGRDSEPASATSRTRLTSTMSSSTRSDIVSRRRSAHGSVDVAARFVTLAEGLLKSGQATAARESLERSLELTPDAPALLAMLGRVLLQLGDHEAAHHRLTRLVELAPQPSDHQALLAEACLRLSRFEEFQAAVGCALEADPGHVPALRLVAEVTLAAGHHQNAIATCETILAQAPKDIPTLLICGAAQAKSGDFPAAAARFKAILQIDPTHALASENLAVCQRHLASSALNEGLPTTSTPSGSPPSDAAVASRQSLASRSAATPTPSILAEPTVPRRTTVSTKDANGSSANNGSPASTPSSTGNRARSYGEDWDVYVQDFRHLAKEEPTNHGRTDLVYPGDEWGKPADWRAFALHYLLPFLPEAGDGVAVEIGQGSGKYTLEILERTRQVVCFDVSQAFINVARERLSAQVASGQVALEKLSLEDCNEIIRGLEAHGLLGKVDLFFSVDSMVHVELHTLFAYFIAASHALKLDGHLVMTVASCTNPGGYQRLVDETAWYYGGHRPGHQFYFLSPDIIRHLCQQLGLDVVRLEEGRDISFVARKVRPPTVQLKSCTH